MAERLWDFHFPDQTCPGCGQEHPGEPCRLQEGLPIEEEGADRADTQ